MITSFHRGMQQDYSVDAFVRTLHEKRDNAIEAHANRIARKMVKVVRMELSQGASWLMATDETFLSQLARKYGVDKRLVPYAVEYTKALLKQRS